MKKKKHSTLSHSTKKVKNWPTSKRSRLSRPCSRCCRRRRRSAADTGHLRTAAARLGRPACQSWSWAWAAPAEPPGRNCGLVRASRRFDARCRSGGLRNSIDSQPITRPTFLLKNISNEKGHSIFKQGIYQKWYCCMVQRAIGTFCSMDQWPFDKYHLCWQLLKPNNK